MDQIPPVQPSASQPPSMPNVPPQPSNDGSPKLVSLAVGAGAGDLRHHPVPRSPLALAGLIMGIVAAAKGTTAKKRAVAAIIVGAFMALVWPAASIAILLPSLHRAQQDG